VTDEPAAPEPPTEPALTELGEPATEPAPDAAPTAPPAVPAAPPGPPPAPAWPRVSAVLSGSFDLVTQSRTQLRNASLYIGLLGLISVGPLVLALISDAPRIDWVTFQGMSGWTVLAGLVAFLGAIAVGIESQIVGVAILGGARAGRPLSLREALRRSRQVFWRVFRASLAVNLVAGIVSLALSYVLDGMFGEATDAAPIGANLLTAIVTAPFVYVVVGIVLGDVDASESIRRSIRLARARFRLAVIASLFAVVTQVLLIFAASSGIDLAARALEPFHGELERLDVANLGGFLLVGLAALIALFAYWTLTFTVGALTSAPQVVSFLGLTGYSRGLDVARERPDGEPPLGRPARVSRPMVAGVVIAAIAALLAIAGR
jgi:hypothetical protein